MNTHEAEKHIQYEGRDENGEKSYFVHYNGKDVGTFPTWDEAYNALMNHIAEA